MPPQPQKHFHEWERDSFVGVTHKQVETDSKVGERKCSDAVKMSLIVSFSLPLFPCPLSAQSRRDAIADTQKLSHLVPEFDNFTHIVLPDRKTKKVAKFPLVHYILAAFLLAAVTYCRISLPDVSPPSFVTARRNRFRSSAVFFPFPPRRPKERSFFGRKGEGRRGIEGETSPSISAPCFIRRLHRGERRSSGLTGEKNRGGETGKNAG